MSSSTADDLGLEFFQLIRRGDVMIVVPSPEVEKLGSSVIEVAAQVVLSPLRDRPATNVIIDLTKVLFFGSEFISFLLRCHLIVKKHGCEMVLAGVSDRIRELLRQTALDTLWAIYDDRQQALEALGGSD
jgi:anti-sigma B factor antagonist